MSPPMGLKLLRHEDVRFDVVSYKDRGERFVCCVLSLLLQQYLSLRMLERGGIYRFHVENGYKDGECISCALWQSVIEVPSGSSTIRSTVVPLQA